MRKAQTSIQQYVQIGGIIMYKLQVRTLSDYVVATFQAGNTMQEANAFYYAFKHSGLYQGYILHITRGY